MSDNTELEELKRQLAEEKAKTQKLEFELSFEDKITKLPNQKYLDKLIADGEFKEADPNLTAIYLQIEGLRHVNDVQGAEAGDKLLTQVANVFKECFGEASHRFKLVGAKYCTLVSMTQAQQDESINAFDASLDGLKMVYSGVDFTYGIARLDLLENGTIEILLKEAEYELHMKAAENDREVVPVQRNTDSHNKVILMIDDSAVQLRTQKAILHEKYSLLMATSGMEGFEIAKAKQPDLILLDYDMPIVDGKRVLLLLRKSNLTKDIPVIFVSGVSEKSRFMEVATLNPQGYLLKPVDQDLLLEAVFKALNK